MIIDVGRDKATGKAPNVLEPRGDRLLKYFSAMWLLFRNPSDIVHIRVVNALQDAYIQVWKSKE